MRILHVVDSLSREAGGTPVACVRIAGAQAETGASVTIAAGAPQDLDLHDGVRCRTWSDHREAERLIRAATAEADLVHLHGVWDPSLWAASSASIRRNIPFLFTPQGMLDPWSLSQKAVKKRACLSIFLRRRLNLAAAVHALQDEEAASLRAAGLRIPIWVAPNGVTSPTDADRKTARSLGPPEASRGERYLLFMGRLHIKKGIDLLLEAYARWLELPEHQFNGWKAPRLLLAGPDDGYGPAARATIQRLGLAERAVIIGNLSGSEKDRALLHAEAFILPSRQEGFSLAVLESLSWGCPVLLSDECRFPEVESLKIGLVRSTDAQGTFSLLAGIETLTADPGLRKRCRQVAADQYGWNVVAESLLERYRNVLKRDCRG